MPISYNIDQDKNMISIIVSGETTNNEWYEIFNKIKKAEKRNEHMNVLFDFRNHKTVVATEVVQELTKRIEQKEKKVKYAFLTARLVSVGMTNMARAFLENKNIEAKAFKEQEEALTWLREGKAT